MAPQPTPQRELRAHRPQRPAPSVLASAEHHAQLVRHLTPRDRWLARMVFEHKVFTTDQIIDLAFPARRAANLRLRQLYQWGVLNRFQPHRSLGSAPMHYVLDTAGALTVAHDHGVSLTDLGYSRDTEIGRAYSIQLAHLVGANSLFTRLIRHSRHPDATGSLTTWWSAHRCGQHWSDYVIPDAYARWRHQDRDIEFFLEFDTGTEQLSRLAGKLLRYGKLVAATGITTPILFWLPTAEREVTVRTTLASALQTMDRPHSVPVATTHATASPGAVDMLAPRWLTLAGQQRQGRVGLGELPPLWPTLTAPVQSEHRVPAPPPAVRREIPAPQPTPPPITGRRGMNQP